MRSGLKTRQVAENLSGRGVGRYNRRMEIIRDDKKIENYARIGLFTNVAGLAIIFAGLIMSIRNPSELFFVQWVSLLVGIVLWQISLYFTQRYGRVPRVDQVLDEQLKKATYKSYLYHYILPASHVLLTRSGPIVMTTQSQSGQIGVGGEDGDVWSWKTAFYRRVLGWEQRLGNPTKTAEAEMSNLLKYISENAPELEEIPIAALIVFTNPKALLLDVDESRIPVARVRDLKKLVRKQTGRALPKVQFDRLREIFDAAAGDLLLIEDDDDVGVDIEEMVEDEMTDGTGDE